jgi:hypothetical protein
VSCRRRFTIAVNINVDLWHLSLQVPEPPEDRMAVRVRAHGSIAGLDRCGLRVPFGLSFGSGAQNAHLGPLLPARHSTI